MPDPTPRPWYEIEPVDAVDLILPADGIIGPLAENGTPCPWPWEPQQLVGMSIGHYHCPNCGSACIAGVRHPDYRVQPEDVR